MNLVKKIKQYIPFETRRGLMGFIFIAPWIIGFLAFSFYPLMKTIMLSFMKVNGLQNLKSEFIGLANFSKAFIVDVIFFPTFLQTIGNTALNTILIIIFSLFTAILLNGKIRFRGAFRTIVFLPVILGSGIVAKQLLQVISGIDIMAGTPQGLLLFLGPKVYEITILILGGIQKAFWSSSIQIVLFISGLQGISESLYESAKVDGSNQWVVFWKITFPMIAPVTLINLIYTIIDSFTNVNNKIMAYIYDTGFVNMEFGYASALGLMYFVFVLILVVIVYVLFSRKIFFAGER